MKSKFTANFFIVICLCLMGVLCFTACKDKQIYAESSDFESYPDYWNDFNDEIYVPDKFPTTSGETPDFGEDNEDSSSDTVDTDKDGTPDVEDTDDDNDGKLDSDDTDDDNDGVSDEDEPDNNNSSDNNSSDNDNNSGNTDNNSSDNDNNSSNTDNNSNNSSDTSDNNSSDDESDDTSSDNKDYGNQGPFVPLTD